MLYLDGEGKSWAIKIAAGNWTFASLVLSRLKSHHIAMSAWENVLRTMNTVDQSRNRHVGFRHASLWLQMQCGHIYTLMGTLTCGAGVYLEAAAAGICIAEQENFHETLHVAHMRHDPDRYWGQLI